MEIEGFTYSNMSSEEVLRSIFEDAARSLLTEHGSFVLGVSTEKEDIIGVAETNLDNVGSILSSLGRLARRGGTSNSMGWFIISPSEVEKLNPNRIVYAENLEIES